MTRFYHPSPNCPCSACQERYHPTPSEGDALLPADVHMVPYPRAKRRVVGGGRAVAPRARKRRGPQAPLVDLLDMPEPDRSVLIAVIRAQSSGRSVRRRDSSPPTQGEVSC